MKTLLHTAAIVAALLSAPAWAQTAAVKVEGAWARASVQGQKATGAFMTLTATAPLQFASLGFQAERDERCQHNKRETPRRPKPS